MAFHSLVGFEIVYDLLILCIVTYMAFEIWNEMFGKLQGEFILTFSNHCNA